MTKIILRKCFALTTAFLILLNCALLCSCKSTPMTRTFFAADTVCTITLYDGNESDLDGAVTLCNDLAKRLDANSETSEIYVLNQNGVLNNPDEDLYTVIKIAKEYAEKFSGVFDPTVRAFTELWDFNGDNIPSNKDLNAAACYVNYENINIEEVKISLSGGAKIELGAIAKGYISQKIYDYLKDRNVTSAVINLGGNVTLLGNKNGNSFSVGIQKPFEDEIAATLYAENCSVVTSGIYQRYIEKDGIVYHHLLNSKTGMPEQNGLYSVTVISESGTDADALSTAVFLLGMEKGKEYIEGLENTEAIFIDSNNNIHTTSGLVIDNMIINFKQ